MVMFPLRKPWKVVVVTLAVLLALVAIGLVAYGQLQINSAEQFNQAQASKEAVLPTVSSTRVAKTAPSATPSTAASTSRSAEPTTPSPSSVAVTPPPIQEVAPAAPQSLGITTMDGGVDLTVKVDSMPYNDELKAPSCTYDPDPECPEKAYWVQDTMGVAPGSSTNKSTYIVGHSWTQSPRVFDKLSDYGMTHYETEPVSDGVSGAVQPKVTLMASVFDPTGNSQAIATWKVPGLIDAQMVTKTANGTLTYKVTDAFVAKKTDIGFVYAFQHGAPNTLVIETCGIDSVNGVDTDYGVVVIGTLVAATPNG